MQATRVVALDFQSVRMVEGKTHLTIGTDPIELPEPLAVAVNDLVELSRLKTDRWLLPGRNPGAPLAASTLTQRLARRPQSRGQVDSLPAQRGDSRGHRHPSTLREAGRRRSSWTTPSTSPRTPATAPTAGRCTPTKSGIGIHSFLVSSARQTARRRANKVDRSRGIAAQIAYARESFMARRLRIARRTACAASMGAVLLLVNGIVDEVCGDEAGSMT